MRVIDVITVNIKDYMQDLGIKARTAGKEVAVASTQDKNAALLATRDAIGDMRAMLLDANAEDMERAREKQLEPALMDRLELTDSRVRAMMDGLSQVATLKDPVGAISGLSYMPSGIQVGQMRVPLGVIGIIYESRPNVTVEAASVALKSGNATILRGGSEAISSNRAIAQCMAQGLSVAGLPAGALQVVETTDRAAVGELITMSEFVDVIVPRGGRGLIERISRESCIPVIKHLDGICHVYIDDAADAEKAIAIAVNAKTQRYGTCNTMETLLIAESVAETLLPPICSAYLDKNVEIRGCERTRELCNQASVAADEDWAAEYLAPIVAIRVVSGMDEAMEHIERWGSSHTDAIVTENHTRAMQFLRAVDSSSVMVNASTRFADGFEYGLGAEVGISTDKLHARGPVGLDGLTSQKYVVLGDGHIRS